MAQFSPQIGSGFPLAAGMQNKAEDASHDLITALERKSLLIGGKEIDRAIVFVQSTSALVALHSEVSLIHWDRGSSTTL
jgi:hypothetical protein